MQKCLRAKFSARAKVSSCKFDSYPLKTCSPSFVFGYYFQGHLGGLGIFSELNALSV